MKAIITAKFEIDVTDWHSGEGLKRPQRIEAIKEELYDFSVFMPQFNYENFQDVEVEIV